MTLRWEAAEVRRPCAMVTPHEIDDVRSDYVAMAQLASKRKGSAEPEVPD